MDPRRCSTPLFAWREALADPQVGPQTVPGLLRRSTILSVALAGLSLHMSSQGDSCFPCVASIAEQTGLDRRTVQRSVRALVADGWLRVEPGGGRGRSNRYSIELPERARYALEHPETLGQLSMFSTGGEKGGGPPLFLAERAAACPKKGGSLPPEVYMRCKTEAESGELVSLTDFRARRDPRSPPASPSPPPVWTFVWAWARARGERRPFPQLDAAGYSGEEALSISEYETLEAEWRSAGSPTVFDPRLLLVSGPTVSKREEIPT